MTAHGVEQATFTIERIFKAPPERVFAAWANSTVKEQWFTGPEGWSQQQRELDFRIGGNERLVGIWESGTVTCFEACYHDIRPAELIVYAYDMWSDDALISVSLSTAAFLQATAGTRFLYTEQGAYFDGKDDARSREKGIRAHFDSLNGILPDVVT